MKFFIKILLFPFALIYGTIIWLRNWLYKSNFIGSTDFEIPVISVGNLSVGGTGKTPFVELLIELLYTDFKVGILSRGYKRKTSGYIAVQSHHTAKDVGDEPLMLKLKYPMTNVSVGEQRVFAIPKMLHEFPDTKVILLDDAFQHQSVRPDINILLTTYDKPFWNDSILPLGTLREFVAGKDRANIIVVTKCPENLNEKEQTKIIEKIKPTSNQKVFFTSIKYGVAYNLLNGNDRLEFNKNASEILVTGIANAESLKNYLSEKSKEIIHFNFSDHHFFEQRELEDIKKNYPDFKRWITTEKDGVRLAVHTKWLAENNISLYCIPIKTQLIGRNKEYFSSVVKGFLQHFYDNEMLNHADYN
ncbi:MAG TPA: tetraacyldisaccharide 4'-kinase [Chitinophagales bacterium]|nr:tetraacyldisaccharide 4'-kinase [Chitinophagales bacterium]